MVLDDTHCFSSFLLRCKIDLRNEEINTKLENDRFLCNQNCFGSNLS